MRLGEEDIVGMPFLLVECVFLFATDLNIAHFGGGCLSAIIN